MERPIIETGVCATLRIVASQVAAGAGLAILRGPVGIGKSFALDMVSDELTAKGVVVARVTATPAIEGNINAFLRAILGQYGHEIGSMADAEEAVWTLLRGYPFGASPKPVLLIIDEAQGLAPRLLEAVRGIWDRGDAARSGNPHAPAFGCILVGNATFLGKGGVVRKALFQPLLDRVTHNMPLPRPKKDECAVFAAARFPDDDALQAELAAHGERRGNFRSMDVAARQAVLLADGGTVTLAHLRAAIKFSGGDA